MDLLEGPKALSTTKSEHFISGLSYGTIDSLA